MELLVGALQIALAGKQTRFVLGQERDVDRRDVALVAERDQAGRERFLHRGGLRTGPREEARAGRRRERHADLELRVVAAPGALIGIGPAMVEDILALRM